MNQKLVVNSLICLVFMLLPWAAFASVCVAHRGLATTAPENSLTSVAAALHNGVKVVELDVRFTSDGMPLLYHDAELSGEKVSDHTYKQLREVHPEIETVTDLTQQSFRVHYLFDLTSIHVLRKTLRVRWLQSEL